MKTLNNALLEILDLELEAILDTQVVSEEDFGSIYEDSIYCLLDEEQILDYETRQYQWLNQGSPSIDDLERLEVYSRESLSRSLPPTPKEERRRRKTVTGYIQVLINVEFTNDGEAVEKWKTVKELQFTLEDISEHYIKDQMYMHSLPYSKYTRIVLYSPHLYEIVGFGLQPKEHKELVPMSSSSKNILLATPTLEEVDKYVHCNSWYTETDQLISQCFSNGLLPFEAIDKGSYNHWEMTRYFLEEVKPTISYDFTVSPVTTITPEAVIINRINNDFSVEYIESLSFEEISKVLFVARSKNNRSRINDKAVFNLVVSIANSKANQGTGQTDNSLVKKVNDGEVKIENLSFEELDTLLKTVWNRSNNLSITDKDLYFKLKSIYYKSRKLRSLKLSA